MAESTEQIEQKRQDNKAFTEWRKRVADEMPELATRVFALRKRMYMGAGLHWSMERELGFVMARVNDYDHDYYHGPNAWADCIVLEVRYEALIKSVIEAEATADEWDREYRSGPVVEAGPQEVS